MEYSGNNSLLNRRKIGFLAGSRISPLSVLPTLDWAAEISKHEDVAIISGFHSMLERQVLDFLLKGKCGIICVLARSLYHSIPKEYKTACDQGRVLFISNEKQPRATKESALRRNQLVLSISDEIVVPKFSTESSLYPLILSTSKPITIL